MNKEQKEIRELYKEYLRHKEDGEEYPPCPRCNGQRMVYAISNPDPHQMTCWEEFPCPLCGTATGDQQIDDALKWIREKAEDISVDLNAEPEEEETLDDNAPPEV